MGRRYIAAIATTDAPLSADVADRIAGCRLGLLTGTDRLMMWSDGGFAGGEAGGHALVGEIFDRGAARPQLGFPSADWAEIARSRGRALVERYWGAWVALVSGADTVSLLRAPLGDLGCYYAEVPGALIAASDMSLLRLATARRPAVDPQALARHIAWPEWRRDETCLLGIGELRGGDRLVISARGIGHDTVWSPFAFVTPEKAIDDIGEAARTVRGAVNLAVAARAASCKQPALLLSGGLDSAVVAISLARAEADFVCVNIAGDDPASDERGYAALAARMVDRELLTRRLDPAAIDVTRSGAAHMPYPVHRCFTQALDAVTANVTQQRGFDAVLDGGGGDNVFFASRTVAILADCLRAGGYDDRYRRTARVLGDLGQTGLWTLAWRAAHRAWLRSPAPRQAPGSDFLSAEARLRLNDTSPHPWFVPPAATLPGRAAHAALLVPAQNLVEALNAQACFRTLSPLVAQPVIEACLRVPSWLWVEPGRDRAAARRAFAPMLPPAIASRRSKGTPTHFVADIYDRHRRTIRDMLLGGRLAAFGLLDTGRLAGILGAAGPVRDLRFVRVMELLDAEAWARAQD
jgi:asparagine synthase (glutamine-hydrolysing)